MDLKEKLKELSGHPLSHQLLSDLLVEYKRPNDKILSLKADNFIQPIKKGLYIAGKALKAGQPESPLLANHILGPSYVSADSALSFYDLIPERVYTIISMTTKVSRSYHTSAGLFTYTQLPLPYYAFGLASVKLADRQQAIIASPEKALFDKIVTTAGLTLRSRKAAQDYLFESLRMEEEDLLKFDVAQMRTWIDNAPKRQSLEMLIKMLEKL